MYKVTGIVTKGTKKNDFLGTREEGWSLEHINLWKLENIKLNIYDASDISFVGGEIQFSQDAEPIVSQIVSSTDNTMHNVPFEFELPQGKFYIVIHKEPGVYDTVYKEFQVVGEDLNIYALPMRKEKIAAEFINSYFACKSDGSVDTKNNSITLEILNAKIDPGGINGNNILIDGIPRGLYVEKYIADVDRNAITVVFAGTREDEKIAGVILSITIMEKAVINEKFPACYSYDVSKRLNGIRLVQHISEEAILSGNASYAQVLTFLPGESYPVDDAKESIEKIKSIDSRVLEILYKEGLDEKGNCKYGLYLINTNVTDTYVQRYSKGVTPRGWEWTGLTWDDIPGSGGDNVLVRISRSDYGHGHGTTSLEIHEMSHNIDKCVYKNISATHVWTALREEECKLLFPNDINYMSTYNEEYFAESHMLYYLNENTRNWLRNKAPKTYREIEEGLPQKLKELYGHNPSYKHLIK